MDTGAFIFLTVVGSITVIFLLVILFRRLLNKNPEFDYIANDGILLTEAGIEFMGFPLMGRVKKSYTDIESVELVRFPATLLLRMRYAPSVVAYPGAGGPLLNDVVVVKLKQPCNIRYHLFNPRDPAGIVKTIKSRIG